MFRRLYGATLVASRQVEGAICCPRGVELPYRESGLVDPSRRLLRLRLFSEQMNYFCL